MQRFAFALFASLSLAASSAAQSWGTAANSQVPPYVQLDYPVAFVANEGHADPVTLTMPHFGLDVLSTGNPSAHGVGGGLYIVMTDGQVKKLFPLPEHEAIPQLIDTPQGQLEVGAVVEPNVSFDGRTLYFAYFHDQIWKQSRGGWQNLKLSYKGSDLYSMDLGPLLDDPSFDPGQLPVKRLTFKAYSGQRKGLSQQSKTSKLEYALNPSTQANLGYWGVVNMHMMELRTRHGRRAVWVSDRAMAANSNSTVSLPNHNFNLYIADIKADGSLGVAQQLQHFTTTSVMSPTPLRNGLAVAYQGSTNDGTHWAIQSMDSEGRINPLLGYGHGNELFHLGSLVVDRAGRDWFVGTRYYNQNNGGFGQLHSIKMADAGTNVFQPGPLATQPRQLSRLLTIGAISGDRPSPQVYVNEKPVYVGKFSSPRGGRAGGEYLMSYTPTSANRTNPDPDGNRNVYEAFIAYRPNLAPFEPHEPVDPRNGKGLLAVVRDRSDQYDLLWPTPILNWKERTGSNKQQVAPSIVDPETTIQRGAPLAQVGSSAIYNTDVRPYDCYNENTGKKPFHPIDVGRNFRAGVVEAYEGLRYVQDPKDFCKYLEPDAVLGVRVNLTSSRPDLISHASLQYETDALNGIVTKREAVETLGVYSTLHENQADHSFQVAIPADTAFELQLLDRRYGMKLVDTRSWHSLKPRETRNDCGGCHQHEAGKAISFEGTEADQKPPLNLAGLTKYIAYDASCKPVLRTSKTPTVQTPEWKQDIWPEFDRQCGDCHNANLSGDATALLAFDYADEKSARDTMVSRYYANSALGALGSPAFWAAYGERTDGRRNDLPAYRPNTAIGDWGYYFSSVHATNPGICGNTRPKLAEWVRKFGLWIDNHMPRDTDSATYGYHFDRFPPTVDFALVNTTPSPGSRLDIRLGHWDNSDRLDIEVELNGTRVYRANGQPNGYLEHPLPPLKLRDVIRVTVTDPAGNRQIKEKTFKQLLQED